MQSFNDFLNMFFSSEYFLIVIVVLAMILLMLLSYLIKLQHSYKNDSPIMNEENNFDIIENKNDNNDSILDIEALNNTQADLVLNLKVSHEVNMKNPIEKYEEDEEQNAIISTKDLEKIEKERDEIYGKENNAKLIEEYEENQEKKAIISYDELLRNACSLELNYIEKPKVDEAAPVIKQVEIKEQPLKGVSYAAEEEYLKILKEFRMNLMSNG